MALSIVIYKIQYPFSQGNNLNIHVKENNLKHILIYPQNSPLFCGVRKFLFLVLIIDTCTEKRLDDFWISQLVGTTFNSQNGQTQFKDLAIFAASMNDHFGSLCIEGYVRYIFTGLFSMFKREHLWNPKHILLNNLGNKQNMVMKFGQFMLLQNKFFIKKFCEKCGQETSSRSF